VFFPGSKHTEQTLLAFFIFQCINLCQPWSKLCTSLCKPCSKLVLVCVNHVQNYVSVCEIFLLSIEIKMQKTKNEYFNVKKVWGRCLGDAAGERRLPNAARTKHIPKCSIRSRLGDAAGDALTKDCEPYQSVII
jgi:hypothetical protein